MKTSDNVSHITNYTITLEYCIWNYALHSSCLLTFMFR